MAKNNITETQSLSQKTANDTTVVGLTKQSMVHLAEFRWEFVYLVLKIIKTKLMLQKG